MSWTSVIGRVAFTNCDPLFHGLSDEWTVLPAPPAWLTGHVLRRDCITAPIPTADYALHHEELMLLPELGIVGMGAVGSVILFGTRELDKMRDIALPSDSSTSKVLLRWLLNHRGLDPKCIETGPDLISMLDRCDGALLIGDRALAAASEHPELVCLDLGGEWTRVTGFPMVFGVFACRRDTPVENLKIIHSELLENYSKFNHDEKHKAAVITAAAESTGADFERVSHYFEIEVRNVLDKESKKGLALFLNDVCGMTADPEWVAM